MWEIVNNDHNRHMLTGLIKKSECSKWMVQSETMIHVSFLFSFSAISMFCDSCTPNWNHIFHNLCFMQANPTSCHILRLFRLEFVVRTDSD